MDQQPRRRTWSFVLVILVALLAFTMVMRNSAPMPPAFDKTVTLAEASSRAAQSGKPVLVFATADWCGPCQSFKKNALKDKTVEQWITINTHAVYLDCTKEVPADARDLPINALPTLLLVRNGKAVASLEGAESAATVIAWFEANAGAVNDEKARSGG